MSRMDDLRKRRDCEHDWAWEAGRMLCTRCGWKRPTDDTLDYAQGRITELEADRARKAEAISDLVDRAEQAEAELAERDEEMATIQWLAREAIAATWPVRPSDETIESEYQELLADARLGMKP